MQLAKEYLDKTESAVRKLFDCIDEYLRVLRQVVGVTFISGLPYGPEQDAAFEAWRASNSDRLDAARWAEREYLAETFAVDTLCGSILQVAGKALDMYGRNTTVPRGLPPCVGHVHARYCIGRTVRSMPLGLVVYAARNQHMHFNDEELR